MLLDEVDNLNLPGKDKNVLRTVLNSGYRRGGAIDRVIKNAPVAFAVFAPVALAGIGLVPPPLMSRSIVIRMQKYDDWPLQRFDRADAATVFDLERFIGTCAIGARRCSSTIQRCRTNCADARATTGDR